MGVAISRTAMPAEEELRKRGTPGLQEGGYRIKRVVWTLGPDDDPSGGGRLIDLDAVVEPDPRDLMIPDYDTGWGIEPLEHPVYSTQPMHKRRFRKALRIIVDEQPRVGGGSRGSRGRGGDSRDREAGGEGGPTMAASYAHCMAQVANR